jgi:hypothetical protein
MKCSVKGCSNESNEADFKGIFCAACAYTYEGFIAREITHGTSVLNEILREVIVNVIAEKNSENSKKR